MANFSKSYATAVAGDTSLNSELMHTENRPIGLVNVANDCYFNAVMQSLFSLESFRNHVKNFNSHIHNEVNAVNHVKQLFQEMERKSMNPLPTHEHLMSLGLPGYIENRQCDAQECMTYIINLFYPRVNDKTNPRHNFVPEN